MGHPADDATSDVAPFDDDDRLGEAIESYLELAERGEAPPAEVFAARFGDLEADVRAALEGLELVHGLVGGAGGSGSGGGAGPGRNIESGRRIAGYRVVRELGRGGMGTVYEAVHVGLDRPVALKVLGTHAAPDSSARRRFLNEARTAAGLHHTHIVPVFDVGQVGGLCYYAMQRIEGSGLDRVLRWLRRGGDSGLDAAGRSGSSSGSKLRRAWARASSSLPWSRRPSPRRPSAAVGEASTAAWAVGRTRSQGSAALIAPPREDDDASPPFEPPRGSAYHRWVARVGVQAAEALAHAHQHGVIHRDVKPSNLLIDADGSIWVADFGLARRLADPGLTHHDGMLGTPRYMSPEQGRTGVIDGRTDVYSLGATLYELLTLRPPFDGASAAELLDQIAGREPIAPRAIDPKIPLDLETIVLKSLAKRPADRYANAAEQAADLERFLNREPVKARRISLPGRAWRVMQRHPGISSVTAAAAVIILAVAAFAYHRVVRARDLAERERDLKVEALHKADAALARTKEAMRETESAMRNQLWRHAELVRRDTAPDRRGLGLDLLAKAAALGPDPEMKARLRDEAVEFLALRDIGPRVELATGPTRDVAPGPSGARLVALTAPVGGEELAFWDPECRRRTDVVALRKFARPDPAADPEGPMGPRMRGQGGGGSGRNRGGPSGERLAPCGANLAVVPEGGASILILDASGGLVRELDRGAGRVVAVFGEPTGRRLASVEVDPEVGPPEDRDRRTPPRFRLVLWDLDRAEARSEALDVEAEGRFPLVAVSADGKTLAAATMGSSSIRLFSTDDGAEIRTIDAPANVRALALGGRDLLAAASEGTVQLWNLAKPDAGGFITSLSPTLGWVDQLRFNPQGTMLAVAGFGKQVELWDALAHRPIAVLPGAEPATDLAFSFDGQTLAVGGGHTATSFWTIREATVRSLVFGPDARPVSIAFREDGLTAVADFAGDVWLWSGRPGTAETTPRRLSWPRPDLDVGPPVLAAGAGRGPAEPSKGRERPRDGGGPRPSSIVFTASGELLRHDFQGVERREVGPSDGTARPRVELDSPGWPLASTSDGKAVALARGRSLYLWDAGEPGLVLPIRHADEMDRWGADEFDGPRRRGGGRPEGPPPGERRRGPGRPDPPPSPPASRVWPVQLAPGGDRLFVIQGDSGTVQAWSLRRAGDHVEAVTESWADEPPDDPKLLALSGDGGTLAIADAAGAITLLDARRLASVGRIEPRTDAPESVPTSLGLSPDGRRLAVGSTLGVQLWGLAAPSDPRPLYRLPGQGGRVFPAFPPDGGRLAVLGLETGVEMWDLAALEAELDRLGLGD